MSHHRARLLSATIAAVFAIGALIPATTVYGIGAPPPIEPPGGRSCDGVDELIAGEGSVDLGETAEIPIYIGSDKTINSFRLELILPDEVEFESIETGTWEWGVDNAYVTGEHHLVISRTSVETGEEVATPSTNDVFLTIHLSTDCQEVHNWSDDLDWAPDGAEAVNYFGHSGCSADPIETITDGSVSINQISILFDITDETALLGDIVTVTITCNNTYHFNNFEHYIQFDPTLLALPASYFVGSGRLSGNENYVHNDSLVLVNGDYSGFDYGTSVEDGEEFYSILFEVIGTIDDVSAAVKFLPGINTLTALDCNQSLGEFDPPAVYYDTGSVTVPAYTATVDLGDVMWNDGSDCEFSVPLMLSNNYRITNFQLVIDYGDNDTPLEFLGAESSIPSEWTADGFPRQCSGTEYLVVYSYSVPNEIAISTTPREIGTLTFHHDAANGSSGVVYPLTVEVADCAPWDDETFVQTSSASGYLTYSTTDDQLGDEDGSITVNDYLVDIDVPDAIANDHETETSINVRPWVDVDEVTFNLSWNKNIFCVDFFGLAPNVTLTEYSGSASVTITDLTASSTWQDLGTIEIVNGKYTAQTGTMNVYNSDAVAACDAADIPTSESDCTIDLDPLPVSHVPCLPSGGITKLATRPDHFELGQNHPNPFNAGTVIPFQLAASGQATLEIFNVMGQRVRTLVNTYLPSGEHHADWDGLNNNGQIVSSGVYLYRLETGSAVATHKMLLLK